MGSCLSKKSTSVSSPCSVPLPNPPDKSKFEAPLEKKKVEEESTVKKEIFIIKHRKSHEIEREKCDEEKVEEKKVDEVVERGRNGIGIIGGGGGPVRTSSCTKEEVDAILIQCGRLSRSSSTGKAGLSSESGGRKYSGSKRSYDFDNENGDAVEGDDDPVAKERENRRRERQRQSQGRRRTPSRDREQTGQQRSGSRERNGSRRVSRSPGRRSESPITTNSNPNSNSSAQNHNSRPGKMVSVPATVSSLAMDKSNNAAAAAGDPNSVAAVKRIQVKRNVGGERTAASPRARSPAKVRTSNENGGQIQQPISLSRSNSRKAENSPYRRNPLGEIDNNIISQAPAQKLNADNKTLQGPENRINSGKLDSNQTNLNCKNQEQHLKTEETRGPQGITTHVVLNVLSSGQETLKPNTVTRSRSSRLSRDLDIPPEALSNPNPSSYTALLLEDIQNFHQKNTPPPAAFSLPPCVTKACSILEAVADLNSTTTARNLTEQMNSKPKIRDPILESEVVGNDDLMQPSFHKYVTVRRGSATGGDDDDDLEEQESSGSNSFVVSSSCWEPNSAESTDRWTSSSSSRSVSRQNEVSPLGFQRLSAKKRDAADLHQKGIARGRMGT